MEEEEGVRAETLMLLLTEEKKWDSIFFFFCRKDILFSTSIINTLPVPLLSKRGENEVLDPP